MSYIALIASGYSLTRAAMIRSLWTDYVSSEAELSIARVTLAVEDLFGTAACAVLNAQFDPLSDEGEAYAAKLKERAVSGQIDSGTTA